MAKKSNPDTEEPPTEVTEPEEQTSPEVVVHDPPKPVGNPPPPEVKPEVVQYLQKPPPEPTPVAGFVRRVIKRQPQGPQFVKSRFAHRAAIRQWKLSKLTLGPRTR